MTHLQLKKIGWFGEHSSFPHTRNVCLSVHLAVWNVGAWNTDDSCTAASIFKDADVRKYCAVTSLNLLLLFTWCEHLFVLHWFVECLRGHFLSLFEWYDTVYGCIYTGMQTHHLLLHSIYHRIQTWEGHSRPFFSFPVPKLENKRCPLQI